MEEACMMDAADSLRETPAGASNASNDTGTSNVVLIGMPGAGKSTLGVVLAKILNMRFVDADLLIQERCGMTLQRIIEARGTGGFIQVEGKVLSSLEESNTVIATGGSAVYSHGAMQQLAQRGVIVYLQITYDELKMRLGDLHERGVVMKGGMGMSLRELFDERKPLYERYAQVTVDVNDLTITAAARKVAAAVCAHRAENA